MEILTGLMGPVWKAGNSSVRIRRGRAQNIMFVLEGLRVCSQTMGLSESRLDSELLYLMKDLVYEELS